MSKRIYIYSPSGAVRDKAAFRRGIRCLQQRGYEVEVDQAALARHTRFAGDDAQRLQAIERACSSGADVALITRGGYGLTRLLPQLPYEAIAQSAQKGMQWVGISDFTAFQMAVLARTGTTTWAGPALCEGFGAQEPDDIMLDCFDDLAQGYGEGTGWRMPASDKAWLQQLGPLAIHDAPLWGGNLCVLSSLLGSHYLPVQQMDGGILFLEDVGEHPYRIERMLTQLLHAGVLQRQRAILLGQFTEYKLTSHDKGFKLATVVQWLREQVSCPVLQGLPYGHVPTKVMLPVGKMVELVVEERDAMMLWGH
ncbi:LD-carboxypeptidase [Curvibacter sp. CHRR-16]|uniref:LD-carboxypeptidase n=1 Tax=Curvibacter sp. CHRR-16 TaxID=2835872 RepID=UPI001BDAAB7A|nr:LD-carboxypeptidase [Curvibacter sp. CHRR-16]